jgi:hypothetical protein
VVGKENTHIMFGLLVDAAQLACILLFCFGTYQNDVSGHTFAAAAMFVATVLVLAFEDKERAKKVEIGGYMAMLALAYVTLASGVQMFSNTSWFIALLLGAINLPGIGNLRKWAGKE